VKNPSPIYPEIARRAGVEGTVWVKIWVDKEGKAKKAQILKIGCRVVQSSRNRSGDAMGLHSGRHE